MSVKPRTDLNTYVDTYFDANGAQEITGPILNAWAEDINDSAINMLGDTGILGLLGYGSLFTITNDGHIPHKKYVDDAITTGLTGYLPLSAGSSFPLTGDLYMGGHDILFDSGFGIDTVVSATLLNIGVTHATDIMIGKNSGLVSASGSYAKFTETLGLELGYVNDPGFPNTSILELSESFWGLTTSSAASFDLYGNGTNISSRRNFVFDGTGIAGIRVNNLTTAQRNAAANNGAGHIIWNTTTSALNYYDGSVWVEIGTGGGTGDFVGPGSATDNAIVRFDGTTGKLGKDSLILIDNVGSLTFGTLGYSDTGIYSSWQASLNGYQQFILRNSSSGASASTDYIVNNNSSTASTFYGDFGINSSGFTGSGSLNLASAVYLSATSGDLVLGTTTSNAIHFVVNSGTTDALTIGTGGVAVFTASTTDMASVRLLDTTYKTALDVSAANTVRIGNGFSALSIMPGTINVVAGVTMVGAGQINLQVPAATAGGVNFTRSGNITSTSGSFSSVLITQTYAPASGTTAWNVFNGSQITLNQSGGTGIVNIFEAGGTFTRVEGSLRGFHSNIPATATAGAGVMWTMLHEGAAPSGYNGDIKLLTAGNGHYVKEGTNATMGTATLSGGTIVVNTTKVTANSRIFLSVNGGTLTNVGAPYVSARSAGTSFTISSTNVIDASDVAWIIIEPA